jgi:hypothetical protein
MASRHAVRDSLAQRKDSLQSRREEAFRLHEEARQRFELATEQAEAQTSKGATGGSAALDSLKNLERTAEGALERLDVALLAIAQAQETNREAEMDLEFVAVKRLKKAKSQRHLTIVGVQLAVALPLILLAGFVLTRGSATSEAPDAGGTVRFPSRASTAGTQEALNALAGGSCPGCHGQVISGAKGPGNFCVHCGLRLFDLCSNCRGRKNAFYRYCPDCGASAIVPPPPVDASSEP